MKELFILGILGFAFLFTAGHYGLWDDFKDRARTVHNYEFKALKLSKKIRMLEKENNNLKATIQKLKAEKEHLILSQGKSLGTKRNIASIPRNIADDLVQFDVYKWSAEKLLGVGEKELKFKNYKKSAQFFNSLIENYPKNNIINDTVLFKAGVSAFESKEYLDWSINHFSSIVNKYPKSKYYRGAKLWLAISEYKKGNEKFFMETVEEFRMKYRNTNEWKILAKYYEDLALKHSK